MYDRHALKFLDKRVLNWVKLLSRAKNEEDIARYKAKVEALATELQSLQEEPASKLPPKSSPSF